MSYIPKTKLVSAAQAVGTSSVATGVLSAAGTDAPVDGGPIGSGFPGGVLIGSASSGVLFYNNLGFFGTTPTTRKTGGENVTNNVTAGGTTGTITNWTNLSTYSTDAAAIRNALYQLARIAKQDHDALRAYGLLT
jgi:hypothetical protein